MATRPGFRSSREDGRDAQAESFMWVYRSGRDGGEQPIVVFDYQPGRGQRHPLAAFWATTAAC